MKVETRYNKKSKEILTVIRKGDEIVIEKYRGEVKPSSDFKSEGY